MASVGPPAYTTTKSVVFPPPPPTNNTLTPEQRSQLRKSTKKLRQILGATPQLIDTDIVSILGPVHIQLPPRNEASSPVLSESSFDTYSSRSSSSCSIYPAHPYAACPSFERESPPSSPSHSRQGSFRLKSTSSRASDNAPSSQAPLLLRLGVSPPSPASSTRPSSSLSITSPFQTSARSGFIHSHTRPNSLDDFASTTTSCSASDMKFTLRPTRHSNSIAADDSISELSFDIPSPSSIRRQKMDRLRKVLGDDVPVHLVFPDQKRHAELSEEPEGNIEYTSSGITPVAVAGTAIPRPKKVSSGKIVGARDSMGTLTPHRAKRQEKQKMERPLSPAPPSPPIVIPASCIPKDSSQKQLCVIVESPEEHGSSPFEGFGFGSSSLTKNSSVVVQSSWQVRDGIATSDVGHGEANKVWSTRKGYTGWDRSIVVGKTEQERKRAMSYRKPPPRIDF